MLTPALPIERMMARTTLTGACCSNPQWHTLDKMRQQEIVAAMEESCMEAAIDSCEELHISSLFSNVAFRNRYMVQCYRISSNIDAKGCTADINPTTTLIDRIVNDSINPRQIATMSSYELLPEASQSIRTDVQRRSNVKFEPKHSRSYTCKKCKGQKTTFEERQTRSSDESSTTFIRCLDCGEKWTR
jgi:DNA-directed RNA polymerase subunit M/transcription elongation factor TFIIS